jgi:DNA-binding response OmpR family regulator
MPRMDGRKCLIEIKKLEKLSQVPVIIYSTSKLDHDMEEMRKLGAMHFITKPNRLSELRDAISFVLDKKGEKADTSH